jgi:hypothetical protein
MAPVEENQAETEPQPHTPPAVCRVRATNDAREEHALAAYVARIERPIMVDRSAKDDDLDGEVCSGRFERVVFADLDALLTAVWDDHVHIDRWLAAGVRLELASPPADVNGAAWRTLVVQVCTSLSRWRLRQRRRRIIAATILSIVTLAALAALLLLAQPAR